MNINKSIYHEKGIKTAGDQRIHQRRASNCCNRAWNENRLDLKLEAKYGNKAKFYTDVWLRNLGLPKIASASELYNKDIVDPYNLYIREAYVEFYGLLSKNLDVKIGKQRIAWGTADMLNPTDNLNPYDLEDVMDFGRHNGSIGINLNYYFSNDFSLQAV